jgi:phosphatidylserine/phosphatidylglycerophosphate/cardiolipin synthase-like enzyme
MRSVVVAFVLALATAAHAQPWQVYFQPGGGAEHAIVHAIGDAKHSVYVQAYGFSNAHIAKALVDAKARGVDVQVILDRSNARVGYSAAKFLLHAGVPTYIDAAHVIAHNKVMVIDGDIVLTGSYNFTGAAEHENAENLLVVDDATLAARYYANWQTHRAHSPPAMDYTPSPRRRRQ